MIWPTLKDVLLTLLRWTIGLGMGAVLGLLIALPGSKTSLESSRQRKRASLFTSFFDFLRALPIIALVPVIQTLGINEAWKIGLIAWAVTFPIWLAVRQAKSREFIDTEVALVGKRATTAEIFWHYRFPKVFGGLLKGVEISIGIAWLSVVAAEWIGTYSNGFWAGGLGYRIVKAHDANNWSGMLLCLGCFGFMGTATAWLWRKFVSDRDLLAGFNPMCGYRSQR
jgi:sulfonate transport system permease protein